MKKKRSIIRAEVPAQVWLPEAYRFGIMLGCNDIRYAIFGAGALAVYNVMIRPTVDIDIVVNDYNKAITLLTEQSGIVEKNLTKDKDGIPVADFHFQTGVTVQIWDNNLYSLPMTSESWSHINARPVPGYDLIMAVSMEDLLVSKIGRYTQQKSDSQYEADKNAKDIVSTMSILLRPDTKYVIRRLREGARRERSSNASTIHSLDWYFVREVEVYGKIAEVLGLKDNIQALISAVLSHAETRSIEYWLLHNLRKKGSVREFQTSFMLDSKSLSILMKRWKTVVTLNGDKVSTSARLIQDYIVTLQPEPRTEYARKLAFSGKAQE